MDLKGLFELKKNWKKEFIYWENNNYSSPKSWDGKCIFLHKKCPSSLKKPSPKYETCKPCEDQQIILQNENVDNSKKNSSNIIFKTIIIVGYIIIISFFIKVIRNNLKIKFFM